MWQLLMRMWQTEILLLLTVALSACGQKTVGSQFRIDERFQIELVASEPLLDGPIAMKFDEKGRILVFESPKYPPGPSDPIREKLLEDTDGDGKPDRASLVSTQEPLPVTDRTSDPEGRIFTTDPHNHVQFLGCSISNHGERAVIYPITEDPVYPVLTEANLTTSTDAIVYYSNRSVPGFERALFTAEPVHNLVHCDLLTVSSGSPWASRARERAEFLASTDRLFRPVSFHVGPDGSLYLVDFYAPVASATEVLEVGIKPTLPVFKASGKGRIYRVKPRVTPSEHQASESQLGNASVAPNSPDSGVRGFVSILLPLVPSELEKMIADSTQSDVRQAAAVQSLGDIPGDAPARMLLSKWRSMTTAPRNAALVALFKSPSRINALLDSLENEEIPLWCLDEEHRLKLLESGDTKIAARTRKLLTAHDPDRNKIVEQYQEALGKKGNRDAGELVYKRLCGRCHAFRGGNNYGPDLWDVSSMPRKRILIDILLPNDRMAPGREMYLIDLKGGGSVDGVIGFQSETCVYVLHDESRQETVLRQDIRRIILSDSSAMPVDLASQLSIQDMADLLRFLTSR